MIHPRVLFLGDPAAATPWVGIAKKLARACYGLKIANKVYHLGSGVTIRVENTFPIAGKLAGISKVWIEAAAGGFWYQFITTGPKITYYPGGPLSIYKGSAVAIKLPNVKADGSVAWGRVAPIVTGSTLEALPDGTPISEDSALIQRVNGSIQVQLVSEPCYRFHPDLDKPKQYQQLMYSWASMPGVIYNAGVFMLSPSFMFTDEYYDVAPTTIVGKKLKAHEPDMDWPHDAALIRVTSEAFGSRTFIVAVDASSTFYCWPCANDEFTDIGSPYGEQGQKVTIPAEKVQSLEAPFPAWVHVPEGDRRDTDAGFYFNSGEPRYVWRFHPQGTKVVGLVLQRETFVGKVYGKTLTNSYFRIEQVELGDVELDFDTLVPYYSKRNDLEGIHPLQNDSPGYVEFSIDLTLTGPEELDFSFGLTVTRQQQADATHYPIAADYLSPVLNGWSSYGIDGSPGDLVVLNLKCYIMEREQIWINRHCGYLDTSNNYIRQSFFNIVNTESNETLLSFCAKDLPDEFSIGLYKLDLPTLTTHEGSLSSIDLSKLSFVYKVVKKNYTLDIENIIYTPPPPTYYHLFQRSVNSQTGLRYYVFGKKVHESFYGDDLGLWSSLNSIIPEGNSYSPLESSTRYLSSQFYAPSRPGDRFFSNEGWWLDEIFYDIYTQIFYSGPNFIGIRNRSIELFDSVSSPPGDADSVFAKIAEYCPACPADYLDSVFVPWVNEMVELNLARLSDENYAVYEDFIYIYQYVLSNTVFDRDVRHASDIYLSTYSAQNRNQRIHNYPIGKEVYMREWTNSIDEGTPMLSVTPEGFYAGVSMQVPYINGDIPYCMVPALPYAKYTLAYYGFDNDTARYTETNKPDTNQLKFATIDVIGHINSETTLSHQELYETAYGHALGIEDPPVRIYVEEDNEKWNYKHYIYEKRYLVNSTGYWHPFIGGTLGLDTTLMYPILNGSMLFSK